MTRQKTPEEYKAIIMLLGDDWFYGDQANIFVNDVLEECASVHDEVVATRYYYDADTMKPLTRKQVAGRIATWKIEQGMK